MQPAPALVRAKEGVFDRIGTLSCTLENDAQTTDCDFGLAKDAGHSAVLVVFRSDGSSRQLNFLDGQLSGTQNDGDAGAVEAESEISDGLVRVSLPGETYSFKTSLIARAGER